MGYREPKRERKWLRGRICWFSWNMLNGRGIHWLHSGPKGRLLLREDVHWYNVSGVVIRTRNTQTFLYFRRAPNLGKGRMATR